MTFTYSSHHHLIPAIWDTWGKRCDGYIAFSNESVPHSPILKLADDSGKVESYDQMWHKSQLIWRVAGDLLEHFDYFLLGGDDLYVIVDNLRALLRSPRIQTLSRNGTTPIYLGRTLRQNAYLTFQSGGAGYLLNAAAVRVLVHLLVEEGSSTPGEDRCMQSVQTSMEDLMVAYCLRQAGVLPEDIRALDGRNIFHPLSPSQSYAPDPDLHKWYFNKAVHLDTGPNCCSEHSVSFHNIKSSAHMRSVHKHLYGGGHPPG